MDISLKKEYRGKIADYSSQHSGAFSAENILKDTGHWSSVKSQAPAVEYLVIEYDEAVVFDCIEIFPSPAGSAFFPSGIRVEGSVDGEAWKVIHREKDLELDTPSYRLELPLDRAKYLKLTVTGSKSDGTGYYAEIGRVSVGIGGIRGVAASSFSAGNSPENLFDGKEGTFWESGPGKEKEPNLLTVDIGRVIFLNRVVLGSSDSGFPGNFTVDVSPDDNVWARVMEERDFRAEQKTKYFWDLDTIAARFVKIEMRPGDAGQGKSPVRLSRLELHSAVRNTAHTHNAGSTVPYSSIFQAGIVRLARDGENSQGTAVQGSDARLRDGSTIFKGIVQIANDGQETEGLVVQASDRRLKEATELDPGIVRLGYDRENKAGVAVQCSDSRLQNATADSFGIVKICRDGMESENAVVTGSDGRLRKATTGSFGICRLAGDGEREPGSVVLSSDRRLRDATVNYKGIVELAEDGEVSPGVAVQGDDRRLRDATTSSKGIVELAEDGEDAGGVSVQGNDRRLRDATTSSKGIVELAENGEVKPGAVVQANDMRLKDATTLSKGIVELAEDGEDRGGVAVQGNDRRLKDATEVFRGILRFAGDGETSPLSAVQGNDRRLKDATTLSKGIVELAEDGETSPLSAVQGNDRRLRDATMESPGIVRLAKDGEERPGVAVQGNDMRLKDATVTGKGILRFAGDGEAAQLAAVQGSDRRLRDATTSSKGIVEFAEDGENKGGVAVQGDDRRLRDATTSSKGIVELAEDGEESSGVAVQGNDGRLKIATRDAPGIVRLAGSGEIRKGFAVQSDDVRLSDARDPLPHTHHYAPVDHDFSSHMGTLAIKGRKNEPFSGITPPSDNSSVIRGLNESHENGSIGVTGVAGVLSDRKIQSYGVLGHSSHVGVRGQSVGDEGFRGCGVLGISRFGPGGVFSSEHGYSLVADGFGEIGRYDEGINLMGNGDALFVNGKSEFHGPVFVHRVLSEGDFPSGIVELFEVDDAEYISPGDILSACDQGKSVLSRSRREYDRGVIGVVSGSPALVVSHGEKGKKLYPVALAGKVFCRVDARKHPVKPGDLIVTSGTPGCGMKGKIDSFDKIGTVIGKALDGLGEGIELIPVFINHQ